MSVPMTEKRAVALARDVSILAFAIADMPDQSRWGALALEFFGLLAALSAIVEAAFYGSDEEMARRAAKLEPYAVHLRFIGSGLVPGVISRDPKAISALRSIAPTFGGDGDRPIYLGGHE